MEFKEIWKEQEELNKLGQNINHLQAYRLYSAGYNQGMKFFSEERIKNKKVLDDNYKLCKDEAEKRLLEKLYYELFGREK